MKRIALGFALGVAAAPWLVRLLLKFFAEAVPPLPYVEPDPEWPVIWPYTDTNGTARIPDPSITVWN